MGNTVSETDPLGRVTTYEYNSIDWNTKINLPAVSGVSSSLEYQYNPAGYMTRKKKGVKEEKRCQEPFLDIWV
jgi:uncharacterized protein RhaS with RHS repeats